MWKAIIFDLDGTLVDTIGDISFALNETLARNGFPLRQREELYLMVGNGMRNLARQAAPPETDDTVIDACAAEAAGIYAANPARYSKPYPGVPELLETLWARGIPTAIISNKPDKLTQLCVEGVLPGHSFRVVQGEQKGIPRKPDPTTSLAIAATLGVLPSEVLFLGDSDVDMQTALAAGFFAVGAAWGFRGRAELEAAGAHTIIEKPQDLLGLLR
jgi:phosphoglycolate phosphatase